MVISETGWTRLTDSTHTPASCVQGTAAVGRTRGRRVALLTAFVAVIVLWAAQAAHANAITAENQQPGTTSWMFTDYNKAQAHEIEGYASATSVNKGAQISFMVSLSSSAQYTMDVYRMGWYPTGTNPDGTSCAPSCGGRLMQHIGPLSGAKQAACPMDTTTTDANYGMVECNWTPSYTLTVPASWTTGNYVVKLTRADGTHLENYMTFVVRDDASAAPIVYGMDVTTWQAYNFWGGAGNNNLGINLYGRFNDVSLANVSGSRAYTVSFDRPYLDQGSTDGAGNFFVWDYPLVRWMESQGYDMKYVTNADQDQNPNLLSPGGLTPPRVFVNTGHDEYYSDNMRASVQNGLNAGTNFAWFSANNIYHRVTWGPNPSAAPDRRLHTDKGAQTGLATVEWRNLATPKPENQLTGVMQNGVATTRPFLVYDATSWIFAGTGLVNYTGTGTTGVVTSGAGRNAIAGLIGYEFDERAANASSLTSFVPYEPAGTKQVGHSFVPASDNGVNAWSDATLYTAPSGANVFSAGTIGWAYGVDNGVNTGFCDCGNNFANDASRKITANILNRFSSPATTTPAVGLSPTTQAFGAQRVGTNSATATSTLSNTGGGPLTISGITVTGSNPGDFSQVNTCPAGPSTLAAGASCTITTTFKPTATGSRSAAVQVASDASGSPHSIALTGTGTAPAASLTPASLTFGSQVVGTASAKSTATLVNTGTAPLSITSIGFTGANAGDFTRTTTCASTLAVGASCAVDVTFAPTDVGPRSATLQVTDDAAGSPHAVAVSGTAAAPDTTAPQSQASAPKYSTSLSFGVPYTATDTGGSGLAKVDLYVQAPGALGYTLAMTANGSAASGTFSYLAGGPGRYSFYTVATDAANNRETTSAEQSATVVDRTAPSSSATAPAYSTTSAVTVSFSAADIDSGVASVDLYARTTGGSTWAKVSTVTNPQASGTFTYTAPAAGSYDFATRATDAAGNQEAAPTAAEATTVVDMSAPSATATAPPASSSGDFTVSYTASDGAGGSGLARVELWVEGPSDTTYALAKTDATPNASGSFAYTAPTDGTYRFYVLATDRAGNAQSAPAAPQATTDVNAHVPSSQASAPAVTNGSSIPVGYSASKSASGGDLTEVDLFATLPGSSSPVQVDSAAVSGASASGTFNYPPSTSPALQDGTYRFFTVARDADGNSEPQATTADAVTVVDTSAPTSVATSPLLASTSVRVGYTAADTGSGLAHVDLYASAPGGSYQLVSTDTSQSASGHFDYSPSGADGSYSFYTVAVDQAGNAESTTDAQSHTQVDRSAPTATATAPSLVNGGPIPVAYTAGDSTGSGVSKVELFVRRPGDANFRSAGTDTSPGASGSFAYSPNAGDGTYAFYAAATDAAGNVSSDTSVQTSTVLDSSAPQSRATAPAASSTANLSIAYTASDSGSGLAAVELFVSVNGGTYKSVGVDTSPSASGAFTYTAPGEGSYAFYTRATDQAGNTETTSAGQTTTVVDTTAPTSAASSPATGGGGSITVGYTASDGTGGSGLAKVQLFVRAPGASGYVAGPTDNAPKASSSFVYTPTGGNGDYSFYTVATDKAGNAEARSTGQTTTTYLSDSVAPTSSAAAPATSATTRISVPYTAADDAGGSGLAKVDLYVRPPSATGYTLTATDATPSANGTLVYNAPNTNGTYAFYTRATDKAGNIEAAPANPDSSTVLTRDITRPSSKAAGPSTAPLNFTVTYTASDLGGSNLASVELWARTPGQSAYTNVATDAHPGASGSFPYNAAAGEGSYAFYTVAVDGQGNRETAPSNSDVTVAVDLTPPTAFSMAAPADPLRGSVSLRLTTAPTDASSGMASVTYQYATAGSGTWKTACTATKSAWGCTWDTTTVPDGSYDLRAIAVDKAGNPPTVSSTSYTRKVDNTSPTGTRLASTNATGALAGQASRGDTMTFTFSEPMKSTSILSGWSGATLNVQARFIDGAAAGDRLEIWNGAGTTMLALTNPLTLGADYVPTSGATFGASSASGTARSTLVQSGNDITLTLGAISAGSVQPLAVTGGALSWTPNVAATDVAGNPVSATPVTAAGPAF